MHNLIRYTMVGYILGELQLRDFMTTAESGHLHVQIEQVMSMSLSLLGQLQGIQNNFM